MWRPSLLLSLLATFTATTASSSTGSSGHETARTFNSMVSSGPSDVEFISGPSGLDGPKLNSVNASVFDWWYFDTVSDDLKSSFVIIFFTSTAAAFPFLQPVDNVLPVYISASFPNGSVSTVITHAEKASIKNDGNSSIGTYDPTGMGWKGAADLSSYLVTINNETLGVKGTLHIKPTAPPHYACKPPGPNIDEQNIPHVGWSNIIPDGIGHVDMMVEGTELKFQGSAYHDKNWGDRPIAKSAKTWYWGHAHVGPYSIVWFHVITHEETEYVSGYISKDGKVLHSECSGVKVHPVSKKDNSKRSTSLEERDNESATTPPSDDDIPDGLPDGFRVEFYSDSSSHHGDQSEKPLLALDVRVGQVIAYAGDGYARWMGNVAGCVFGQCGLQGRSVFEQILLD